MNKIKLDYMTVFFADFILKISADLFRNFSSIVISKCLRKSGSEPKFLKILKCNSAESTSAGFQFIYYDIFNG
jgi:hypothetical protein